MTTNIKLCRVCRAELEPTSRVSFCSVKCRRKLKTNNELSKIHEKAGRRNKYRDPVVGLYQGKCAICGWQAAEPGSKDYKKLYLTNNGCEIHHILPVSKGGTDDISNLILLCPNHHKLSDLGLLDQSLLYQSAYAAAAKGASKRNADIKRSSDIVGNLLGGKQKYV